MHGPAGGTGGAGDGRPTEPLSLRELFDLNAYWLAINILWGALGISLLPVLMVDLVCHGESACLSPTAILPGLTVGKGTAEAIIVNLGVIVAILVQPTVAAISDHTTSRIGRRKPFILVGTLFDMAFLVGFYLAGRVDRPARLLLPAPVQLELRAGAVPGLHARSRPGQAGRAGERADGPDDPARRRRRGDAGRGRVGARQRPRPSCSRSWPSSWRRCS